jgi:hypothetical protein
VSKVKKAADQTVTSSTTLVNDSSLSFAVAGNETWSFDVVLFVRGSTQADVKVAFTVPSGATINWGGLGAATSAGSQVGDELEAHATSGTGSVSFGCKGTTSADTVMIHIDGLVVNSNTAGTVQLQWAQANSTSTGTVVLANSFVIAHKW